jgi:hypothetical protein
VIRQLIRKYQEAFMALLTVLDVICAAGIVNQLQKTNFAPAGIVYLAILACSIIGHVVLFRLGKNLDRKEKVSLIERMLEMTARALVYPQGWETVVIRSYCHTLDRKRSCLHYVTSRASDDYDDVGVDIPLDAKDQSGECVFVIAQAVLQRETTYRELPAARSPAETRAHIWKDIGYVLACPIFDPNLPRSFESCLGVVSIDASRAQGAQLDLDGVRARDIIGQLSRGVGHLWA